jgi:hypothetical protein
MKKKMTIVELFLDSIMKTYRQFIIEGIIIQNPKVVRLNEKVM